MSGYYGSQPYSSQATHASGKQGPTPLSGRDLIFQPLPDIIEASEHTRHPSKSAYRYVGLMDRWKSFESEVRATSNDPHLQPTQQTIAYQAQQDLLQRCSSVS